jgi:hypothetical protein
VDAAHVAFALGSIAEVTGLLMTTVDIWWERAVDAYRHARETVGTSVDNAYRRFRRWIGRPVIRRVTASATMPIEALASAKGHRSPGASGSVDEQLDRLRAFAADHDRRLVDLEEHVERIYEQSTRNLRALRAEMREAAVAATLEGAARYHGVRVLGLVLATVGMTVVLVTSVLSF